MDPDEQDEILWRLDERTKKVDDDLERLFEKLDEQGEMIRDHEHRISNNEDDIRLTKKAAGSFGAVLIATISSLVAKLAGLVRF